MAGKPIEINGDDSRKLRTAKHPGTTYVNSMYSPKSGEKVNQRLSPVRMSPSSGSPGSSPRTSPGLLAGHYAGCKWSEPPPPSSLPLPPQHWMLTTSAIKHQFHQRISDKPDIECQLKVLLNVQA